MIRLDEDVIASQDAVAARKTDDGMPRWLVLARWPSEPFWRVQAATEGEGNAVDLCDDIARQGRSVRLVDLSTAVIVRRRGE